MMLKSVVAILALGAAPVAALAEEKPSVSVVGYASEDVRPDTAFVTLTVTDDRLSANDAANENARLTAAVIDGLKGSGVDAKDIATANFSLVPIMTDQRDPKTNLLVKTVVSGFRATNRMRLTVHEIDRAGAFIANAVQNGGLYQGVNFDLSDRESHEDALRAKAVANAAHRAELYAKGAGAKLGPVRSIANGEAFGEFPQAKGAPRMMAAAAAPAPLEIEPGLLTLSQSVNVVYDLATAP